ncbi:MAG: hypothetical protein RMM08_01935 [Armatimonadota bacterium]|nr:hypothetical protein [bacterium]MDW8320099.1 hypothetical protein [Armatimonadota bacterium]
MQRQVNPAVIVLVIAAVLVVIGLVWAYLQRSSRVESETIRQQVEQELYREGELGHRPGEVPARSTGR